MNQISTTNGTGTSNVALPGTTPTPSIFKRFQPLMGGQSVDLSPSKQGATAAMVIRNQPKANDEVLCVWVDGVTFAPTTGNYWVVWFTPVVPWCKPSGDEIKQFMIDEEEEGPPTTVHLHPPPTLTQ